MRLALRWIAVLHGTVPVSLAAITGVHTFAEVVKLVLAGTDLAMMASALLRRGPVALSDAVSGLRSWLRQGGYESVAQAKGSLSRRAAPDPGQYERANYMESLISYSADWRRAGSRIGGD